jgi:AraC family transcriptional regulator
MTNMPEIVRAITCGTPMAAMTSPSFTVTDVHYRAGDAYAAHAHERAYAVLILSGGFREQAARRTVELTSGGVIVMPPGHAHRDEIGPRGARGLLVTLESTFPLLPRRWAFAHGGALSRAMIGAASAARFGVGETLAIEEHLVTAMSCDAEAEVRDGRASVRVARDVLEAGAGGPLRLRDVAAAAGVDPAYLSRAFRRCAGTTMGAYLRSLRARRAAALLSSTAAPLAEIALASGFSDQSHCCRVFRAEYGITPRRFRELAQGSSRFKT